MATNSSLVGRIIESAPLNHHTALEAADHVPFDNVDEAHQDDFTELTNPFTRLNDNMIYQRRDLLPPNLSIIDQNSLELNHTRFGSIYEQVIS